MRVKVSSSEELRTKFLILYSNLPLNLRKEVIAVLGKEPISWSVAYLEINANTKKGKEILSRLAKFKII